MTDTPDRPELGQPDRPSADRPAPRPGVVPLRPLDLGEIFAGAVGYIRANPVVTLGLAAAVITVSQLLAVIVRSSLLQQRDAGRSTPGLVPNLLTFLSTMVAVAVLTGLLIVVVHRAVLGQRTALREALSAIGPRLSGLIGLGLFTGLIITGVVLLGTLPVMLIASSGARSSSLMLALVLLLAALAVAVYVGVLLAMAVPAYVLEDIGVVAALFRSRALVLGTWWRIFGILLLTVLLAGVVDVVIGIPFDPGSGLGSVGGPVSFAELIASAIGTIVASTLTAPFSAGVTGLLYIDQRIRRERYDIELARSATRLP